MSKQDAFAEAVFFFEGSEITVEMHFAEFEALLDRSKAMLPLAASVARGAYVVVGTGLAVRGLVCFQLRFDEDGHADPGFSVPLRHLVRNAGAGPDVGCGPINLASRRQCSVSWHAMNLWEPEGEGEASSLRVIQRAAWRNRIGLKLSPPDADGGDALLGNTSLKDTPLDDAPLAEPSREMAAPEPRRAPSPRAIKPAPADHKIDQAFGEEGRVSLSHLIQQHNQNLDGLARKHRGDLEQQQQTYLDQISGCRDEIQRLKGLLRHEQNRNRRLQQLLRGEVGP